MREGRGWNNRHGERDCYFYEKQRSVKCAGWFFDGSCCIALFHGTEKRVGGLGERPRPPAADTIVGGMLRTMRGGAIAVVSDFYGRSGSFSGNAPEDGLGVRRDILDWLDQVQISNLILRRLDPRDR